MVPCKYTHIFTLAKYTMPLSCFVLEDLTVEHMLWKAGWGTIINYMSLESNIYFEETF